MIQPLVNAKEASPMNNHNDGWPELTYRYIEHYYWEPQHLFRTTKSLPSPQAKIHNKSSVEDVYKRLRSQEVPLNYLLSVLLRLVPSSIRVQCLETFGIDVSDPGLCTLTLKTPWDYKSIQPDIHLESATARVFIEVKVGASLKLNQIKKYVAHHVKLNTDGKINKRPYVLFLVKPAMLTINDIKQSYTHESAGSAIAALLGTEAIITTFGSTSWSLFGQALQQILDNRSAEESESTEMLTTLIGDFLADLNTRNLLQE